MGISKERFTPVKSNWKCVLICFGIALSNCQYGLDAAIIGGFQAMPGFLSVFGYYDEKIHAWNIETQPQQLIASCMNIGTIIGVAFAPPWARYWGRRPAIWVASAVSFISLAVQISVTSVPALCVGRVLLGISNAFYIAFANIYISESAPHHLRAPLGVFFGVWVGFGSIIGNVVDYGTSNMETRLAYQIPLAVLFVVPFFLSILIFFIPESPRWLLVVGRPQAAERALERLRGNSLEPEFFKEEYEEMLRGIEDEKALASGVTFMDMFRGADLRRTVLCVGTTVSHSSSGIWVLIAYGTYFYKMAGVADPFKISILTTFTSFVGVVIGMYVAYDLLGRRPIMLFGTGGSVVLFLAVAIAYNIAPGTQEAAKAIIAFFILYSFFCAGFSSNLTWPIANELVSSRLRVVTFSFATGINYFFSWLISYCSPLFINPKALNWGGKYFYIWAASNAITYVFFYFLLPELKGRSLEEIDELFENRVSVKDFPKYECISATRAHEAALHDLGLDKKEPEAQVVENVEEPGKGL